MNSSKVEFVAEIGSNHKGIKSLAYEMIRQFSQAGATICKFQLGHERHVREGILIKDNWMRNAPMEWVEDLSQWCDDFGVEFMASIWSQEGLDAARSANMKRYKIAHQMKDNKELWDSIAEDGKDTFVSAKISGQDGYENTIGIAVSDNYPYYPGQPRDAMPSLFTDGAGWHYGYSSHMHGIADALVAIMRGACYIEKHVTLDKTEESIKDNSFSLSPDEFADMVKYGKEIHRLTS